jgi:pimeloyl-ACP methyl ester carboxylesterase
MRRPTTAAIALLLPLLGCEHDIPDEPPCGVDHGVFLNTPDGAVIHLHRHQADGPPVLVVHGISSNHYCWDLDEQRSIGTHLATQGFDTWLLDMRGHGDARRAEGGHNLDRAWTADDYGLRDIPTAVAYIQQQTGHARLGYVGHSLGGMVGAIYASQVGDEALWAMVVVGSPAEFTDPDPLLALTRHTFGISGATLPFILTPQLARLANAFNDSLPIDVEAYLFNDANMEEGAAKRMMHTVVSPLWPGEMLQFASMIGDGAFQSRDGAQDYRAAMANISVPVLAISGRADRVAPPDRVRGYYEAVGSEHKQFVVAGRENGFAADYGHLDLPIGDHAPQEIYPLIDGWLRDHLPAEVTLAGSDD